MIKIENENMFLESMQQGINLFLGAGFSVEAVGIFQGKKKNLPAGDGLRLEILQEFGRNKNSTMQLPQLCQVISSTQRDKLNSFFRSRFDVVDFNKIYANIERLNIKSIFTTNIDNLIYKIFEDSQKYYVNDISLHGPSISGASAIDYIALHGSIVHPSASSLDFSPVEIASSFERDKDKWFGFIDRVRSTPTLYWGYSVGDAGVLQALSKGGGGRSGDRANAWVTLLKDDDEAIEYYSSLGFNIIISNTLDLLKYIGQQKVKKIPGASRRLIDKRFSEYMPPVLLNVPVRTINEFYMGAEPIWYDVYMGGLHKTKYFDRSQNSLAGDKNCLLVGGAVTGKTTLLKQLASRVIKEKQSLYINEITKEKAKLLLKDIDAEGIQVIVYIDNAADAWEAIEVLSSSKNINIVAAERDYIFDSVAHRFYGKNFDIIDVSGLVSTDIQSIINKIPEGLQRSRNQFTDVSLRSEFDPTFLDVMNSVLLRGHMLSDRFIDAMKELRIDSPVRYSLLLICCYMYACRVPLSVDVAISYFRDEGLSIDQIYEHLKFMSSLISRYEGVSADTKQDHYVPRSRVAAEIIIQRIGSEDLRTMLENFHTRVSTTKIPRYDIFRRGAYDANHTSRAFEKWEDGLRFYEMCESRDKSHSLKQQAALFFSRKRNYSLAFKWIDDAKSIAGSKGASVKNTYAVILFNANYDKPGDDLEVVNSLNESMDALRECYFDDLRKSYHAKVFGDQAVKYYEKFPDSTHSMEYLIQAKDWLNAELVIRKDDRSITRVLGKVSSSLNFASRRSF